MEGNPETPHNHPLPTLNLHETISANSFLVEEIDLNKENESEEVENERNN